METQAEIELSKAIDDMGYARGFDTALLKVRYMIDPRYSEMFERMFKEAYDKRIEAAYTLGQKKARAGRI